MPLYVLCPHCGHPAILPSEPRGRREICRQCGQAYYIPQAPAHELAESRASWQDQAGHRPIAVQGVR